MSGLSEATLPAAAAEQRPAGTPSQRAWPTRTLLAAWTLLGVGVSVHDGEWSPWGLATVLAGFALLLAVVASGGTPTAPTRRELAVPLLASLVAAVVHPAYRLMHVRGTGIVVVDVLAAAAVAGALLTLLSRRNEKAWIVAAAVAVGAGIATIVAAVNPHIDVWFLLQQSSDGLRHGENMYRQHWQHSHGLRAVYPYLPVTTVLLAPFRWLTGDVRAGLLLATLLTSLQLRRWAPAAPAAVALLVFTQPHWVFLIDQSWTEPMLLALITAAMFSVERGRPGIAVVALAAAVASKQHMVLLLPLFALWPAFGLRRTLYATGLAALAVLPWVVWSPHDFWHDAVTANLALGELKRALCIPTLLLRHGITVGFWFPLLVLVVCYAVALVRAPRNVTGLALASALVLWGLDIANKQSFFNHYTLPLGLIVVALTAASVHVPKPRQP